MTSWCFKNRFTFLKCMCHLYVIFLVKSYWFLGIITCIPRREQHNWDPQIQNTSQLFVFFFWSGAAVVPGVPELSSWAVNFLFYPFKSNSWYTIHCIPNLVLLMLLSLCICCKQRTTFSMCSSKVCSFPPAPPCDRCINSSGDSLLSLPSAALPVFALMIRSQKVLLHWSQAH